MNDDVRQVGEKLKARRAAMNMTLKEVENATSIRAAYLEAIERGEIGQFISGVYAFGFTKQYAQFLGLDTEKLMHDHPLAFKVAPEKHEFSYGIGTLEMRGTLGGGVRWLPNLIWAVVAAFILVLAWIFIKSLGIL